MSHDNWQTPPELWELLNQEFGFVLDAAANEANALCPQYLTLEQDALVEPWITTDTLTRGAVWCNPPYSRLGEFVARGRAQAERYGITVVMLIPAYTDPKYWWDHVLEADEIRFLKGRVQFLEYGKKRTSARFPSVVVVWRGREGIMKGFPQIRWWDWRAREIT